MKRVVLFVMASLGLTLSAAAQEHGGATKAKEQKENAEECKLTCPISNEPIAMDAFAHYHGKRVYFCCANCKGKFEKDPDKFVDAVKKQWDANPPLRTQVSCPVTGGAINAKVFVSEPMYDIYFANEDAKKQYLADKSKYTAKLGEVFTYQTKCVVMGGEIDPTAVKEIDGKKVYFCCMDCESKFMADKEGSFKKLAEQMKTNEQAYAKLRAEHAKLGKD